MDVRAHLGLEVPPEPDCDYVTGAVLEVFSMASRSRRYISGTICQPLPIGVGDITEVLTAHPVPISRRLLDSCIFAVDNAFLDEVRDSQVKE